MAAMTFRFETTCLGSDYESIRALIDAQRPITRQWFARRIGKEQWAELRSSLGYDARFPIGRDWHVGYYRSTYRGKKAVFLRHSGIEHIYTEASR